MSRCTILNAGQAREWNALLSGMPVTDIYFTPEYCRISEWNGEGRARLFVYEQDGDVILYPFLLRRVNELPGFASYGLSGDWYDITTPYGYGGPLARIAKARNREQRFADFAARFADYCAETRIISEFVRFHPLLRNDRDYRAVRPELSRRTIHVDLRPALPEIERKYNRDNRNRIRKALREGLTVRHTPLEKLDSLLELYYRTMDKLGAEPYYYFPPNYFRHTVTLLKGHVELIEVLHDARVIASCLFLHCGKFAHYHLMGSERDALPLAPVNLLLHHAVQWAKGAGLEALHLGGGYADSDSLYRFKKSFNELESNEFHIGRKIHRPDVYQTIRRQLSEEGLDSYFPVYRHPRLRTLRQPVAAGHAPHQP